MLGAHQAARQSFFLLVPIQLCPLFPPTALLILLLCYVLSCLAKVFQRRAVYAGGAALPKADGGTEN